MLGERPAGCGTVGIGGVGGQDWGPSDYPHTCILRSFLCRGQVACSPIPLEKSVLLQLSLEVDGFYL